MIKEIRLYALLNCLTTIKYVLNSCMFSIFQASNLKIFFRFKKIQNQKSSKSEKMNIGKEKKQKVQHDMKRSLLFKECPDEVVLIILSFCPINDIQSTRIWQTDIVRHSTETTIKLKAAENNNLDNLKWIHSYIGDTEFDEEDDNTESNCTGK